MDNSSEDYTQRLSRRLWEQSGLPARSRQDAERDLQRGHIHKPQTDNARSAWDLAVAFAVRAAAKTGEAREHEERRCLSTLERAIAAGHPPPQRDHPDFAGVADNPRFQKIAGE